MLQRLEMNSNYQFIITKDFVELTLIFHSKDNSVSWLNAFVLIFQQWLDLVLEGSRKESKNMLKFL